MSLPPIITKKRKINQINNNEQDNDLEDIKENGQNINNDENNENNENEEKEEIEDDNEVDEIKEEEQEKLEDENNTDNKNESQQQLDIQDKTSQNRLEKVFVFLKEGFSWRPIPTINTTVTCLEITGIIFIIIGLIIFFFSRNIKEIQIRYDDDKNCQIIGEKCEIDFQITEEMKKNVFVYYRLKNFYQNHRRYIKSKSNKQLKGNIMTENEIKDDCDPIILNRDIYLGVKNTDKTKELNPDAVAHPCGLIAKSFFNDTYEIKKKGGNEEIIISKNDIAWSVDKERYKNSENYSNHQWLNVEDERFMVWMRPAALPDFRKPWGRIERDLSEGNYTLIIENNYPVKSFDGKKYFILSTVNGLGGKNYFLAILYFVMGGISIISGILFFFGYNNYVLKKNQKVE